MLIPGPRTSTLAVRVTVAALWPALTRADVTAVRRLPFVLTHLDDAAVVAGALADPVGTAVRAPVGVARFGIRTVGSAPGAVVRGVGRALPGRK